MFFHFLAVPEAAFEAQKPRMRACAVRFAAAHRASKGICSEAVESNRIETLPANSSSSPQTIRVIGILGNISSVIEASPKVSGRAANFLVAKIHFPLEF